MATQAQNSDIITTGRQLARATIDLMGALKTFDQRYTAGGYSALVDGDFIGANEGILAVDFVTAVSSFETILTAFDAGQDTNMEKVTV